MKAVNTTEKSVYFYETIYQYHDIPGGWHHHIHRHDNLKSHALHPDCAFRSYFEDLQLRTSLSAGSSVACWIRAHRHLSHTATAADKG
jgi:hypothetical protein